MLRAADWQALAAWLREQLPPHDPASPADGAQPSPLQGLARMGTPAIELTWTAVPCSPGWLVWLDPVQPEHQRLQAQLNMVIELARIGVWERDFDSGEGRWDRQMFELTGFDPAAGAPTFEQALQRVHPEDRMHLQLSNQRALGGSGRYETRYRLLMPDGQVRHVHALCEVQQVIDGRVVRISGVLIDETEVATRLRNTEATAALWVRALDLAAVALWRLDLIGGRVFLNDWGHRMLGLDPGIELTVGSLRELIHPDDRAAVLIAAQQAAASHGEVDVEARYRHADGSYRHLFTRRVAERDERGRVIGLSGVSLDLTERITERERARAFAQRIELITNAAGVGIWSVDVETDVVEWNAQMFRLYGVAPDQPVPHHKPWLDGLVHPDDREIARQHRVQVSQGRQTHSEFRIIRPDGEVRWIGSWARKDTLAGREMAFGINMDITELRHAQTQLRQMQERIRLANEAAGIGTWERDLRTQVAKWDAQMYRLRGLPVGPETPPDELRHITYHPDDREQINRDRANAGRDGDHYENEFRVVLPDGTVRWLATRGLVKRDGQGEPERMFGVTWDVTERRRAEQALRDKLAAERASHAKSEFLARMSHELRTPLNAVLGFAQLMANDTLDALSRQQRDRIKHIHSAGLHLLALIDDVLDLATIESESLVLASEPVALQDALDDVLQWTRLPALEAGVALRAQPVAGWVRADPRRLRQVLSNLVGNAIKYNRSGGEVWVLAQPVQQHGEPAWRLSVRDTGPGLSAEQRAQLFQPFNRLGAERSNIPGTGIGLAIVNHLVRLMGGEMAVSSELGQGSDFQVILPAMQKPPLEDEGPASGYHSEFDGSLQLLPLTLLYIEDNPVNVLLVQELVALRSDMRLSIAVDGLSGVAMAVAERPDVVLVDMQLPDIDGYEVLLRLRAESSLAGSTFVALSANAMPEDVARARQAGFDDYWTKPIDFQAFLRALGQLARHHAERIRG